MGHDQRLPQANSVSAQAEICMHALKLHEPSALRHNLQLQSLTVCVNLCSGPPTLWRILSYQDGATARYAHIMLRLFQPHWAGQMLETPQNFSPAAAYVASHQSMQTTAISHISQAAHHLTPLAGSFPHICSRRH